MSITSRRLSHGGAAVLALAAMLAGAFLVEAQAPPPPVTKKKTPTPTPRAPRGGGGGGTSAPAAARATLLLDADLNCTVTIDGETSHKIMANKPTKIDVAAGEHLLKAVSEDGRRQLEQIVKGQGGGNTVVPIKLLSVGVSTRPEDFDRQAAKVCTAITDLKVMGAFIDGLWKRSFFFHDRGITAAFHTAKQVLKREMEEFKKFTPSDPRPPEGVRRAGPARARGAEVRGPDHAGHHGRPDRQQHDRRADEHVRAGPGHHGHPERPRGLPADHARRSPAFKEALAPDVRPRIGLPPDNRDIRLGADYAQSFPQMFAVIDKGGAADSMGFKPGDRVISVDGRPVDQHLGLQAGPSAVRRPQLTVVYERQGKQEKRTSRGRAS